MTIRVRRYVEPLSLASRLHQAAIIESDAYRQVANDLEMYVNGQILGRSFLVAGHRGAGKTTMLRQAVQEVDARIRSRGASARQFARPLFIALHGPDLLAPPSPPAPATATSPVKPAAEGKSDAPTAEAGSAQKRADESTGNQPKSGGSAAPHAPPPAEELRHFLDRITSGLYFGAAQEFARRFREQALSVAHTEVDRAEFLELSADLQVQLDRLPDLDRLRDYWRRIDALNGGVLFERATDPGRGVAELAALFSTGRVMRTFAGKYESSLQTEASRAGEGSVSLVTIDGQNLLPPLIGLVSGVGVWSALPEGGDPLVKALAALLTGFGAVLALKVSATRSHARSQTLKETFIPQDDPGSLYRVLPSLIERFQQVGLFPVFVVDELDKVPGLGEKINALLGYMKQFVTERAFFCFVTNRSFYQHANAEAASGAYSTLHTRFGDSVFVRYHPKDFHDYLELVLDVQEETDPSMRAKAEEAAVMLRYLLMSRSYLHPYDLRRELAQMQTAAAVVKFTDDQLLGSPRLQREVAAQVAVEIVYRAPELQEHLHDPLSAQTVLDALYYPIRMWRNGENELDLTPEALRDYLVSRTGIQEEVQAGAGPVTPDQLVPSYLQRALFPQVERVMDLLCDPRALPDLASVYRVELPEPIVRMLRTLDRIAVKVTT
ncbi:MAG TPA: hypothetical protein VE010_15320 [Thermoanaerobaculia bacterium]|nr:hypothetical protein [Thermoanaerobaculia bacterium]